MSSSRSYAMTVMVLTNQVQFLVLSLALKDSYSNFCKKHFSKIRFKTRVFSPPLWKSISFLLVSSLNFDGILVAHYGFHLFNFRFIESGSK